MNQITWCFPEVHTSGAGPLQDVTVNAAVGTIRQLSEQRTEKSENRKVQREQDFETINNKKTSLTSVAFHTAVIDRHDGFPEPITQ